MNDYTRRIKLRALNLQARAILSIYEEERIGFHETYEMVLYYRALIGIRPDLSRSLSRAEKAFESALKSQNKFLYRLHAINVQRRELRRHKACKQAKIW